MIGEQEREIREEYDADLEAAKSPAVPIATVLKGPSWSREAHEFRHGKIEKADRVLRKAIQASLERATGKAPTGWIHNVDAKYRAEEWKLACLEWRTGEDHEARAHRLELAYIRIYGADKFAFGCRCQGHGWYFVPRDEFRTKQKVVETSFYRFCDCDAGERKRKWMEQSKPTGRRLNTGVPRRGQ